MSSDDVVFHFHWTIFWWIFDHLPIVGALLLHCITLPQSNPFFIEWFGHFHSYFDINTNSNTRWEIWWTLISLVILCAKRAYKMWEIMTTFDQDDNSARFWQRLELIAQPSVEAVEPRTYLNMLLYIKCRVIFLARTFLPFKLCMALIISDDGTL